jgi:hypothetical protein
MFVVLFSVFGWAPLRSRQSAEKKKTKEKNRKIIGSFTAEIFLVFVFFHDEEENMVVASFIPSIQSTHRRQKLRRRSSARAGPVIIDFFGIFLLFFFFFFDAVGRDRVDMCVDRFCWRLFFFFSRTFVCSCLFVK